MAQFVKLEKPIQIPSNPFWEVFRTFGRDELLAGIISIFATIVVGLFIQHAVIPTSYAVICLVLAGPIFEKLGFFIGHFKDAYEIYSTTPIADREDLNFYLKRVLRGGGASLFWDIILHDPIYIMLMLGGMFLHPETPAWLLVPVAFGVAVLLVATIRVGLSELGYWWFKQRIFRKGFEIEEYFEAKFFLSAEEDPEKIIIQIKDQFLPVGCPVKKMTYEDIYYSPTALAEYNARSPRFRIRTRKEVNIEEDDSSWIRTAQTIYTRAVEHPTENDEQFRFFPTRKDKFYLPLSRDKNNDSWFPGLEDGLIGEPAPDEKGRTLNAIVGEGTVKKKVKFIRRVTKHPRKIYVSVDSVEHGDVDVKFHVVEIKAYLDRITLLKEAMRFIMTRFNVLQTTRSKLDLLSEKFSP